MLKKANDYEVKFSILMPVYNVEVTWLKKAVKSIENQSYKGWELCIVDDCSTNQELIKYLKKINKNKIKVHFFEQNQGISKATNAAGEMAEGDYILLMDNDDALTEGALMDFYTEIMSSHADIIYSDQDIIDENDCRKDPLLKPDWSLDLFLSQMYLGHLLGFKKSLFDKVGGFRTECNGSQDYDLVLRMLEHAKKVAHIPRVLYSWRALPTSTAANPESKPYAQIAGQKSLQSYLDNRYGEGNAIANESDYLFVYDVRYPIKKEVKASIIIPTKDHADVLSVAIDSILTKTTYTNYEIIILNNNSEEKATYDYFRRITKEHGNIKVVQAYFEFNWSKLNNEGVKHAAGETFIFLNNDVEVITPDWLERLVENSMRKDVGAVGPLLLYPDGTIQHAGVVLGMGGWADHVFKGMDPVHYGSPFVSPMVTRNVMAVTGACLAVSKRTLDKIGLFNEDFIICGSDIELCIRAHDAGFVNVYNPNIRLYHHESKSRDSYIPEADFELSDRMYHKYRVNGDPYFNIQLDYYSNQPKVLEGAELKPWRAKDDGEKTVEAVSALDTNIYEITPYTFRLAAYPAKRINLLVPSLNPEHVFGGISTALKFFEQLIERLGYDSRIIVVDSIPRAEVIDEYSSQYEHIAAEKDSNAPRQIVAYNDRAGKSIPVSNNDYFMFTGWWTAHCAQEAYEIFEQQYGIAPNKFIYFIQDYEPGFYSWSSKYLLADASYKNRYPQIGVFNTGLLREFFHINNYHFHREFEFEPVLNQVLKEHLYCLGDKVKKKKQVIVYGRPGTERNAFTLIIAALKKWVWIQPDIEEWDVLSAGEQHDDVALGNGKKLVSVGKLTLDEYAELLSQSYAGISLMVSPHPSYPPLEMSVFGVKVITNTYVNKDLKDFNDNIVSVSNASPDVISSSLLNICEKYEPVIDFKVTNADYCENTDVFYFIDEIKTELEAEK
jgi:GT2 family glycosyltransferase